MRNLRVRVTYTSKQSCRDHSVLSTRFSSLSLSFVLFSFFFSFSYHLTRDRVNAPLSSQAFAHRDAMYTQQNGVAELVLKAVVFQDATGAETLRRLRHTPVKNNATAQKTTTRSRGFYDEEKAKLRTYAPDTETNGVSASTAIPFTFHVPPEKAPITTATAATHRSQQQQQQSRLREALRRHEDALRAWADAPLQDLPSPPRPHELPPTAATSIGETDTLPAGLPSRVTLAVVRPYCRVLAKNSLAGIGVPQHNPVKPIDASVAAAAPPTVRGFGNAVSQPPSLESSVQDGGYAASQSSLSDCAVSTTSITGDAQHTTLAAPLLPYQLPLRMRCDASPSSQGNAPSDTAHHRDHLSGGPATFQRAQEQRYAAWRQHQMRFLHGLSPDMFGRTQPSFAVADVTPQVMDGGLRNGASVVRRSRLDRGVVYV